MQRILNQQTNLCATSGTSPPKESSKILLASLATDLCRCSGTSPPKATHNSLGILLPSKQRHSTPIENMQITVSVRVGGVFVVVCRQPILNQNDKQRGVNNEVHRSS
jgi:hypothetical protein